MRIFVVLFLLLSPSPSFADVTGEPADLPDSLERLSQRLVQATLGAPQTAQFRKMSAFRLSDQGWAVCGEVRSTNLTGITMPWKPIFIRYQEGAGQLSLARRIIDWPANVACQQLANGRSLRTRR